MCGRFTLATADLGAVRQRFGLDERVELRRRFNVAPGDDVVAVTPAGGALLRWGYLRESAYTTINARAESLSQRPTWRQALRERRCLVLADGFYEWRSEPDGRRTPHWITRADRAPFAFAGLASPWGTCAIVTTAASERLASLHARMPVMLEPGEERAWLARATPQDELAGMLDGYEQTAAVAVGSAVNDARCDGPECLAPAPPPPAALF